MKEKKRPYRMPFGIAEQGGRLGGVVEEFSEGYFVHELSRMHYREKPPYNFAWLVFASRERIFRLFSALVKNINQPCTAMLKDHRYFYATYRSKPLARRKILDAYRRHSFQLVNDGDTEFSIESRSLMVAVRREKNIDIFSNSLPPVHRALEKLGISHGKNPSMLRNVFLDYVPIHRLFGNERIKRMCEPLPRREVEKYESDPKAYNSFFPRIVKELRMESD